MCSCPGSCGLRGVATIFRIVRDNLRVLVSLQLAGPCLFTTVGPCYMSLFGSSDLPGAQKCIPSLGRSFVEMRHVPWWRHVLIERCPIIGQYPLTHRT